MNGILCAYLRATEPSTPSVEATALQPPSIASFTMFSGSKYGGIRRERRAGRMLDALIDRQDRHVAGAAQAAVSSSDCRLPSTRGDRSDKRVDAVDEVGTGQVQGVLRNRLALVLQQARVVAEDRGDPFDAGHGRSTAAVEATVIPLLWLWTLAFGSDFDPTSPDLRETGIRSPPRSHRARRAATSSSIGRALLRRLDRRASRARVSGMRGVNSVQQSWSGMIEIG